VKNIFLRFSVVFAAIYFFSLNGFGALPNLSVNFLLKNQMGMDPAQMAYFQAVTLLAWVIKPLWGLISDCLPISGSRRKSYLILTSVVALVAWLALAGSRNYTAGILLAMISVAYMAYAFQDVVTDGWMIEIGKPQNWTGQFQSIQWSAVFVGMILTAFLGGHLADLAQQKVLSYQAIFAVTALFPLLTLLLVLFLVKEPRRPHPEKEAGADLKKIFGSRDIWILSSFLFLWNFSPSFGAPFFYYCVDVLKFSGTFLGYLQAATSFGALAGSALYGFYIVKIPVRRFLIFAVFAGVCAILFHGVFFLPGLIARGLLLKAVALLSQFLFGLLSSFIFLSLLNLAAKTSPQYAGGTVFALLMSFYNLGLMGSSALGGLLYPVLGLKLLLAASAFFSLLVLFLMPFLPLDEELTGLERALRKLFLRPREAS